MHLEDTRHMTSGALLLHHITTTRASMSKKKFAICEIGLPIAIIAYYYYYMYIESYLIIFHQTFCIIKPATIIAERYTMHEHLIELIKHSNTSFRLAHKFTNEWIVKCHGTADPRGSLGFESQTVKVESVP